MNETRSRREQNIEMGWWLAVLTCVLAAWFYTGDEMEAHESSEAAHQAAQAAGSYECGLCGQNHAYEPEQDEAARKELREAFGEDAENQEMAFVCDDCHARLLPPWEAQVLVLLGAEGCIELQGQDGAWREPWVREAKPVEMHQFVVDALHGERERFSAISTDGIGRPYFLVALRHDAPPALLHDAGAKLRILRFSN